MDDTNLDFLEDLLPWSEKLPEECKKRIALQMKKERFRKYVTVPV